MDECVFSPGGRTVRVSRRPPLIQTASERVDFFRAVCGEVAGFLVIAGHIIELRDGRGFTGGVWDDQFAVSVNGPTPTHTGRWSGHILRIVGEDGSVDRPAAGDGLGIEQVDALQGRGYGNSRGM